MPKNHTRKNKPKRSERESGLGRTLEKSQSQRYRKNRSNKRHDGGMAIPEGTIIQNDKTEDKIVSILEVDELTDFLGQAEMANREFQSERERFVHIDATGSEYRPQDTEMTRKVIRWYDEHEDKDEQEVLQTLPNLSFPRRPVWENKTREELDKLEKESFLNWRRQIAKQEEELYILNEKNNHFSGGGFTITPFEKNIEIWRQLWRVIERSTILLQIVDARNPLYYFSSDLKNHIEKECSGKETIVLLNKSDYLSDEQRQVWNGYFRKEGVNHLFFSSYEEQVVLDNGGNDDGLDSDVVGLNTDKVLTRKELLHTLHSFAKKSNSDGTTTLGMVGFPNVGKSSFINVLLGISRNSFTSKRVAVAAQPGKTKHFQTMVLPSPYDKMIVCDCPGLVFPSFASSKADLILNGVYPIAHIRGRDDWFNVVDILCKKVPSFIFEYLYGLTFPPKVKYTNGKMNETTIHPMFERVNADELLTTYCTSRKLYTAVSGIPDYQPASRTILSDYTTGKLLYCHAPPDYVEKGYDYYFDTIATILSRNKSVQERILKQFGSIDEFLQTLERPQSTLDNVDVKPINEVVDKVEEDESSEYTTDSDGTSSEEETNKPEDDEEVDIPLDLEILDIIETINDAHPMNNKPTNKNQHKTQKKWGKKGRKLRNKDPYGCHSNVDDMDGVVNSVVVQTTTKSYSSVNSGVYVNAGKYGGSGYTRPKYGGAKGIVIDKNGRVVKE